MEDRTFFQVDQATSQNQGVLGAKCQCGEDTDLYRTVHLSSRCNTQETTRCEEEYLRNFTDIERVTL